MRTKRILACVSVASYNEGNIDGDFTVSVAVVSFYMKNIKRPILLAQASVIRDNLPKDFSFFQILTSMEHQDALDNFLRTTNYDKVIFLDVDCIPIQKDALQFLADSATDSQLVGCAQRANHIANGNHIYAGPFCMAVNRQLWNDLGQPSCVQTERSDVAEELTFLCEEKGKDVKFLWPSSVDEERWELTDEIKFGIGTAYEGKFWHLFESRRDIYQEMFVNKCKDVMWNR